MLDPNDTTKSERMTVMHRLLKVYEDDQKGKDRVYRAFGYLQSLTEGKAKLDEYYPSATRNWCGCRDWEFRNAKNRQFTGPCKHIMLVILLEMIEQDRQEHDVTAPVLQNRYVDKSLEGAYRE